MGKPALIFELIVKRGVAQAPEQFVSVSMPLKISYQPPLIHQGSVKRVCSEFNGHEPF